MQREGALITEQVRDLRLDSAVMTSVDVDAMLSDCIKSSGGVLTSDLVLSGSSLNVYGGNYMQTSDDVGAVYNFSGKNSFIQAEEAWNGAGTASYGPACTGCKGFALLHFDPATGRTKLSGDISQLAVLSEKPGWSVSFAENAETSCITVIDPRQDEISAGTAVLVGLPPGIAANLSSWTEESCIWRYDHDDNALYYPPDPAVGNLTVYNFYGNHAEGGSVKAIGKYSHAEGRSTVADIRYSHAEGSFTYAGGMAAHAEGNGSPTDFTVALGQGSHAEGQSTKATGKYSHAEGGQSVAAGDYSVASGYKASALSARQFVWSGGASGYSGEGKGAGSFCVNPAGGLGGFYVGDKSLEQHLIDRGAATIKADLKASLSAAFEGVSDPEDVEFGKVAAALSAIWLKVK